MAVGKVLIVYFSQGGANARIAEAIATGLRGAGHHVDLWNLRNGHPPDPRDYQLFGIGSPVYYYHVPVNVVYYVEQLPGLDGIDGFVFIVHGTRRIDTANWLRRRLARKGMREVGYFHCRGEAHVLPLLREGYLFSPDRPSESELLEAKLFGESVAERVAGKPYARPPYEPKPPFMYRLEKALASRWLIEHFYSRLFRVDPSKCTACGLCMEVCPTSNITKDAFGRPQWDRRCLACLSCEMTCPEEAITSAVSRPFPGALIRPFFRYNVHRWVREGDLDYVRVVHRRGETHRVGATGGDRPTIPDPRQAA
ncbi:MAG TPA: EFR1 family ferrodoxin [Burkholderiales bacterium]|nr:EFR1 family ferrodoxin [Burkholderiales bacterium]